jgi:hypothetical protein
VVQLLELLKNGNTDPGLARLLPYQTADDLKKVRGDLNAMAKQSSVPEFRQAALASIALADDSFDNVWNDAQKNPGTLVDLLNGISLIPDAAFRAKAYDRVKPLLAKAVNPPAPTDAPARARYVRIELPRTGTLTLAEVEVFSGGQNIARNGKAKQSSTSNGGAASRAIDGRTDGDYGSGTLTHSREDSDHPWWEVDLGSEQPIESVNIWNRREGELGKRLDGFTLTLLDDSRHEVFSKSGQPAPAVNVSYKISHDAQSEIDRAAIRALVSMNHEPAGVFNALADIIASRHDVTAASQGMRALPRSAWPKDAVAKVASGLVSWAETIPTSARTAPDYVETVQFATDIVGYLPADQAKGYRAKLKELRVPVFIIRTVREQMRFDTPRIVVELGKSVEIT